MKIIDDRWRRETGVSPAQLRRHFRVMGGEAFDVRLVNQRLVPGNARRRVVAPGERRIDDDTLRYAGGAVGLVDGEIVLRIAALVAEQRVVAVDLPGDRLG